MAQKVYYSVKGDGTEVCYPLANIKERIRWDFRERVGDRPRVSEITLEEWKTVHGTGTFWCIEHGEGGERGGDMCGSLNCDSYKPRNGKNGICVHHRAPMNPTGKTITLKRSDL